MFAQIAAAAAGYLGDSRAIARHCHISVAASVIFSNQEDYQEMEQDFLQ
jgi:hypothetical protein